MNLEALAIAFGILIFVGIFGILFTIFGKGKSFEKRIRESDDDEKRIKLNWQQYVKQSERVFKPLGDMIPRSPEEMSRQGKRLMYAGIRHKDGPAIFYGVKLAAAITIFTGFALSGYLQKNPVLSVLLSILFGAAVPDFILSRLGTNRKENIQLAIPDVLDLTVVCVEAGMGLDQALLRIGNEIRPVHRALSDELRLYNLEINAGRSRADALRNLANRVDVDDLKALVAVLIQTDRFGTGIALSLRVFSDSLRTKRRQRAEERAAKTAVKMVPVLVFFIFPAIFVVVIFPAFLAIMRELLPKIGGR